MPSLYHFFQCVHLKIVLQKADCFVEGLGEYFSGMYVYQFNFIYDMKVVCLRRDSNILLKKRDKQMNKITNKIEFMSN